jgi:hypothetical protein
MSLCGGGDNEFTLGFFVPGEARSCNYRRTESSLHLSLNFLELVLLLILTCFQLLHTTSGKFSQCFCNSSDVTATRPVWAVDTWTINASQLMSVVPHDPHERPAPFPVLSFALRQLNQTLFICFCITIVIKLCKRFLRTFLLQLFTFSQSNSTLRTTTRHSIVRV